MDVGTGDGRFVLDRARSQPDSFVIGIDPVASAMADASRRAAAKPVRGGVDNAMFLQVSLEHMPGALAGISNAITVNYPWGSLLRAVALPDVALLSNLAALAAANATLDVLINMHPLRDVAHAQKLGLADAAIAHDLSRLCAGYAQAGFALRTIADVTGSLVNTTRWGSQLHYAGREILRLTARKSKSSLRHWSPAQRGL